MSTDELLSQLTNALFALIGVGAIVVAIRRQRRVKVGAADHLTKPIDAARLRRWLQLVADGKLGGG